MDKDLDTIDIIKEANETLEEANIRLRDMYEQLKEFRENHPERKKYTDRFVNKQDFIDWLKDLPFEWISFRYLTENGFRLSHVTVVDELKEDQNAEV